VLTILRLNLEILIDLRHLKEKVDNGGRGEIVGIEKIGKCKSCFTYITAIYMILKVVCCFQLFLSSIQFLLIII